MTAAAPPAEPWPYDVLAEIYDDDMGRNAPAASVEFYLHACEPAARAVLELGAGTGRLALPLARAGHAVTAVDRSAPMLDSLRRKADAEGALAGQLTLVHADMRGVNLARRFDAVLCAFSAFNYLLSDDDRTHALDAVRSHLAPGGTFVMDLFVPDPGLSGVSDGTVTFDYRRTRADGTVLERHRAVWKDVEARVNLVERRYRILSCAGAELSAFSTRSRIRYSGIEETSTELARNGFDVLEVTLDFHEHDGMAPPRTAAYRCRPRA